MSVDKLRVSSSMLLSCITPELATKHLPSLPIITNEIILELNKFRECHHCTSSTLHSWMNGIYGKNWPHDNPPSIQAIIKSVDRLVFKLKKLQKQRSSSRKEIIISSFLKEEYTLPKSRCDDCRCQMKSGSQEHEDFDNEMEEYKENLQQLKLKLYASNRNAKKRQNRRDALIEEQNTNIKFQQRQICHYQKKLEVIENKLSTLKAKLARVNHRVTYWRAKLDDVQTKKSMRQAKYCNKIEALKQELYASDLKNAELREALDSELSSEIDTFEKGKYNDDVRACVYELLSLNVGVRNIAPIILCVLKNMAHKSVTRLPKHASTCKMILEALIVVQAQLGEELSQTSGFNTLQTDGTTKYGNHYATYDISSAGFSYTLGVRHVFSGSAQNTLETFEEILDDIDCVQQALGKDTASSKIIAKIKNTMSDRHSAEKLFNDLIHDFRAGVLPTIIENWDHLHESEQEQFSRMNNFFCGLHFVVGLADAAEEAVKLWESNVIPEEKVTVSSGTQRLIRTACKAFHHKGSQQSGSATLFQTYLRKHNIQKIPLAHFVGNRFNILFYDAAGVYYLQSHMITFIESVHGNHANRLLQAVLADLKNPVYIAGCRALGLIDKVITGPLWRKLKEPSISVLQMSHVYSEMKNKFDSWNNDASEFANGKSKLDSAGDVDVNEVWNALTETSEGDSMTKELLQLLFGTFSITTQRMLIDHLPGGKFYSSDDKQNEEISSVPTTNVAPERDFAILDRLLHEKPNATSIALEAMILFSHNKTASWLDKQSSKNKEQLFQVARTLAPTIKKKYVERRNEIEKKREDDLNRRQKEIARLQHKKSLEKEKLVEEIKSIGLWTKQSEVNKALDSIHTKTAKVKALKLQFNFRQKVLGQTHPDKSLFKFSHNGKQYSVEQLKSNLCKILEDQGNHTSSCENVLTDIVKRILSQPELLVGKKIKQRFSEDGKLVWYEGIVLSISKTREYEVVYDEDDDIYCFPLLDDIKNGDLIICT